MRWRNHVWSLAAACWLLTSAGVPALADTPLGLIFDTDVGNDVDDALALAVIHALEARGECKLLAVTISKDNDACASFVDAVNTFYGRGDVPIGVVRDGPTPEASKFLDAIVDATDGGAARYPHDLASGRDAPEAVALLRQTLAAQPDDSVALVVVGFSTNVARLLESKPDEHSPLSGRDLAAAKCRLLSIMADNYGPNKHEKEYNVHVDAPAARSVFAEWPTPIVASGFEIGQAIPYPAESVERDYNYVRHHPIREAYENYLPMPYDRPTWDLTSVLYAVHPDRGYFGLSEPCSIHIDASALSVAEPDATGRCRFLTVAPEQIARVREALIQFASQPPQPRLPQERRPR